MNAYVGDFECPMMGKASIQLEGEKLVLRIVSNPDLVADPTAPYTTTPLLSDGETDSLGSTKERFFSCPTREEEFVELKLDVPTMICGSMTAVSKTMSSVVRSGPVARGSGPICLCRIPCPS